MPSFGQLRITLAAHARLHRVGLREQAGCEPSFQRKETVPEKRNNNANAAMRTHAFPFSAYSIFNDRNESTGVAVSGGDFGFPL